jgi:class 3 adenylate cyclase/tetratricopeptide (TPR) repeat protein
MIDTPPPPPGASPGRRYRLTVLFADVSGSTQLAEALEAEQIAELLGRVREVWREVASRHGGCIVRMQGDGALLVFGYPEAGEDDGRRAAEAALEVHAQVRALPVDGLPSRLRPIEMHSGIHVGTLILAPGDIERGRFDLTGDVANTAAHLAAAAGRGEVLASQEALGPHAHFFELADDRFRTLPGRSAALRAAVVCARTTTQRRFDSTARRGLTPFIGREELLETLRALVSRAAVEPGSAVLVGPAGVGKTRLLEELRQQSEIAPFLLLRGSCESYLGAEVLQPFLQMLRLLLGITADTPVGTGALPAGQAAAAWRERLGEKLEPLRHLLASEGAAAGARSSSSGVGGDLLTVFAALCAEQPVLLLIDDWQWADDASRQLLEALFQLPRQPAVVLATRPRTDRIGVIAGAPHFELRPFAAPETLRAVKRWLPDANPFVVAEIHAYAGGVPLYIEELCHSVGSDGQWRSPAARSSTQTWLASLVASRLARLPEERAQVVRAAAVIGNAVPLALLEQVSGRSRAELETQRLAEADFLYPDERSGMLRFKHGVTRDAVYESIGRRERIELHERIVAALQDRLGGTEGDDSLEAFAYHHRAAGHWAQSAHFAERAGDKAMAAFAPDRARAQYFAAMDGLDRLPAPTPQQWLQWCTLANKLGMASIFDPLALAGDLAPFERAADLARQWGTEDAQARARYWLGYMCYGFGRHREGVRHLRDALSLARHAGEPRLVAQIEATLGQVLAATCDYDESLSLMTAAVDSKRRHARPGGGMAIGSAYSLSCIGCVLADRGEFDAARVAFDEALALLGDSTHPVGNSVRNWISVAAVWQGRWADAQRVAAESARIAENTRALLLLAVCRSVDGYIEWAGHGDAAGLAQLREAVRWMEAAGGHFYMSLYCGWLVEACVAGGAIDEARRHAARLLLRSRNGERLGEAVGCRALAIAASASGDPAAARRWIDRADASARLRGSVREDALNRLAHARLAESAGQAAAAWRQRDEAIAALRRLGMHWHAEAAERQQADPAR